MASYQDIEARLGVVERKLDFIMNAFTVTKQTQSRLMPEHVTVETKTLLQAYRELQGAEFIDMVAGPTAGTENG